MSDYKCSRCDATWMMLIGTCVYCPVCQNRAVPMTRVQPRREEDEDEGIIGDIAAGAVAGAAAMALAGMLLDDDDSGSGMDSEAHEDFEGGGGESGGAGSTDEW